MPSSYVSNHVHIVFSTKNRLKVIPEDLQPKLWANMAGIAKKHSKHAVAIGGIAGHAIALGSVLVTNNERHFSRVTGLKVENWTRR
jgi:tRNA(fMet)-specific endonuclease VapC